MSDCPECGMRDDDWFLCRREPCAINKTKRDGDRIADLERQIAELRAERDEARGIVRDIHWMAVRYADNRKSYAVGMCNDALRKAYDGGWLVYRDGRQNDIDPQYARDGMFDVEWRSAVDSATARAEAAEAENARLRALPLKDEVERVMEPFAHIGTNFEEEDGWSGSDKFTVTFEDKRLAEIDLSCFYAASALLSRLRAGEQEGWRTMDSAPKDGTKFLAFESGRYFDCWWHDAGYGEAYWRDEADSEPNPSLWLPLDCLPAAPSEQGGDRG